MRGRNVSVAANTSTYDCSGLVFFLSCFLGSRHRCGEVWCDRLIGFGVETARFQEFWFTTSGRHSVGMRLSCTAGHDAIVYEAQHVDVPEMQGCKVAVL
jgi:hypothetical protein